MAESRFPVKNEGLRAKESVWDYPRPPSLEAALRHVRIVAASAVIAESRRPLLVKETSHPPVYYLPPDDVRTEFLRKAAGSSFCEWKGSASYFDVVVGEEVLHRAAFCYPNPSARYRSLAGFYSFYASPMDEVTVDGERVTPQEGGFYSGWITSELLGPFKGAPGTQGF